MDNMKYSIKDCMLKKLDDQLQKAETKQDADEISRVIEIAKEWEL